MCNLCIFVWYMGGQEQESVYREIIYLKARQMLGGPCFPAQPFQRVEAVSWLNRFSSVFEVSLCWKGVSFLHTQLCEGIQPASILHHFVLPFPATQNFHDINLGPVPLLRLSI